MFSKKSCVEELVAGMERNLVGAAIKKQASAEEKLVKAANYLNAAAEIFDESGLAAQAEVITVVLESLAAKKTKKKVKSKAKPVKKAPTSEKMVENLKEKGWVFDESKANDVQYVDDNCASCGRPKDRSLASDKEKDEEAKLYDMLQDFKQNQSEDFEEESPVSHDPDTLSDEAFHPDAKWRAFQLEDPEYSEQFNDPFGEPDEPRDPVREKNQPHLYWEDD